MKLTKKGEEEILKIVDRCFRMYASAFKNYARESAIEMIGKLENIEDFVKEEGSCENGCNWKHEHTNWWKCTNCGMVEARQ